MTALDVERFTYLPQTPANRTLEADLDEVIRILAKALAEDDRRPGHLSYRPARRA